MFGGGSGSSGNVESPNPDTFKECQTTSPENHSGNEGPSSNYCRETEDSIDKKHSSSGVGIKLINVAKTSLLNVRNNSDAVPQPQLQKLVKQDPAFAVPQGSHNNSAGESCPSPRSTFLVGVWEDRNKKCRRTMEDTHAFLYNFLATPGFTNSKTPFNTGINSGQVSVDSSTAHGILETDNGYFAIFDGHAGALAADWCGKKLHIILEDIIRNNPNQPIPQLLDECFCTADTQLEKLPLKNSGCTAAIALLRWEDRIPTNLSVTGSQAIAPAIASAMATETTRIEDGKNDNDEPLKADSTASRIKSIAVRQRVLYTANVGDARIVLCRNGKALRLSYDHKGSDKNEGKRITNAGGLILNNRVNGVLAVTRALGDSYMKELVTGHPYTTETIIQPEIDEFIIIACDGLWDVCSDQEAVDLIRNMQDPVASSKLLVEHALSRFSTDNLSCMVVRFDQEALKEAHKKGHIGVEENLSGRRCEVDKIATNTKQTVTRTSAMESGS